MMNEQVNYMRQTMLFDPSAFNGRVVIVGLGNIGSNAAMSLVRLGIKDFKIYDDDKVEAHNITSQYFSASHLGFTKSTALATQMRDANPAISVNEFTERFTGGSSREDEILIIAVDTMAERRAIQAQLVKTAQERWPRLIIDARVGGPQIEIYTFNSANNVEEWAKTFSDNPSQDPCGGRFIAYVSVICGALISNTVKKFLKGEAINKSFMLHVDSMQMMKDYEW